MQKMYIQDKCLQWIYKDFDEELRFTVIDQHFTFIGREWAENRITTSF